MLYKSGFDGTVVTSVLIALLIAGGTVFLLTSQLSAALAPISALAGG